MKNALRKHEKTEKNVWLIVNPRLKLIRLAEKTDPGQEFTFEYFQISVSSSKNDDQQSLERNRQTANSVSSVGDGYRGTNLGIPLHCFIHNNLLIVERFT